MTAENEHVQTPQISVVIATYNRARMLERCLQALVCQSVHPTEFEVIVIDDGSTDDTPHLLAKVTVPYVLRIVGQENAGQATALNTGVKIALGPFCLFLDDDIIPASSMIAGHLRAQRASGGAVVMGRLDIRLVHGDDGFARVIGRWWRDHYDQLHSAGVPTTAVDCHGANLSVPVSAFSDVGGFDPDLPRGYDAELAYRLTKLGCPLVYANDALGVQEYGKRWREAFADLECEGAGGVQIYRKHPELLAQLTLGQFRKPSIGASLLRRMMLSMQLPTKPLAWMTANIPDSDLSFRLRSFICSYAYWRGAQKVLAGTPEWQRFISINGSFG